jgi:adenosine deaminase CECR1
MRNFPRVLLFVLCLACLTVSAQTRSDYDRARRQLLRAEKRLNPASTIQLTAAEKAADAHLSQLKTQEIERTKATGFPPANNFLLVKPEIDRSPLLAALKRMPKGAVLHAHPGALGDFRWLISYATYQPNCYVYLGPDKPDEWLYNGNLTFRPSSPGTDWHLVSELRAAALDKTAFDEKLYQSITLGPEDLNVFDIWEEFEKCFARVDGLQGYLPIYRAYFRNELESLAAENVDEVEVRAFLSGPNDLEGNAAGSEVAIKEYREAASDIRRRYPDFKLKIIFTWTREAASSVPEKLGNALELRKKYPDLIVGFDLVGEEEPRIKPSHSLLSYVDKFLRINQETHKQGVSVPYYFHAGETNWTGNENMFDALLLNSRRVGHGLALIKHPYVMSEMRRRQIPVEICPISNQVLRYIPDLRNHPAVLYLRSGIPITINPDDPGMMGYTFSYDFYEAVTAWDLNLGELKLLAMNSIRFSAMNPAEKQQAMRTWQRKWRAYAEWLSQQAG